MNWEMMKPDKYICYIGRPSYQKNPLFLVEVVKDVHILHPEVKFVLLGVGYYSIGKHWSMSIIPCFI